MNIPDRIARFFARTDTRQRARIRLNLLPVYMEFTMSPENESQTDLIVTPELNEVGIFKNREQAFIHNFDGDLRKQWGMMSRAQGGSVESLGDHLGEVIPVRYVYAHRVGVRSQADGSMVSAVRSVIVTPDGKCFDTVSTQIANRVGEILRLCNGAPIDPPLNVVAVEVKARSGFRVMTLEAAE